MQTMADQQRRNFSVWLRTGRRASRSDSHEIELKFNPWHDPEDGRFTFAGTGQYFGPGSTRSAGSRGQAVPKVVYSDDFSKPPITNMAEADAWKAEELAKHGHEPGYPEAIEKRYQFYKNSLAHRPASQPSPSAGQNMPSLPEFRGGGRSFGGGGGSFGGGGTTGDWDDSPTSQTEPLPANGSARVEPPSKQLEAQRFSQTGAEEHWSQVCRNGYLYEIDAEDRTRRISGDLALNANQGRSQAVQRAAGGSDRRTSDHGGHYIARRFNGPTEAFNHFAQDANFNRGDYRKLEEEWAQAKRSGKDVRVKIVPSQRPSALNVWFWIDGTLKSRKLPNEPKGTKSAE